MSDEQVIQITTFGHERAAEIYQHALTNRGRIFERYALFKEFGEGDIHRCAWSTWYETHKPPMPTV